MPDALYAGLMSGTSLDAIDAVPAFPVGATDAADATHAAWIPLPTVPTTFPPASTTACASSVPSSISWW